MLFNTNYDPPEETCKYFTDLVEDLHAMFGRITIVNERRMLTILSLPACMVHQMLRLIPLLSTVEEAALLCSNAVEKVLFERVYEHVFAMYKIKVRCIHHLTVNIITIDSQNKKEDTIVAAKLQALRDMDLKDQFRIVGTESGMLQILDLEESDSAKSGDGMEDHNYVSLVNPYY